MSASETGMPNAPAGKSWRRFLPALILILAPLLVSWQVWSGHRNADPLAFTGWTGLFGTHHKGMPWIDPNVGFQAQALGKLAADQWLAGQVPWWNSYTGAGLPLAAEAQPAALFLPFILLMHFQSGVIWLELLLQMIAGLSTYAVLRRLGLSPLAAVTGGLLFEFNGTFAWMGAPITTPIAFLPLLTLGMEMVRDRVRTQRPGGWLLIPLALAASIYAGFPETAYLDGLFAAFWMLVRCGGLDRRQTFHFMGRLAMAAFVGALLAAPQILSFAEYVALAHVGGHAEAFAHARLPAASLVLQFMPRFYGVFFEYAGPMGVVNQSWGSIGGYLTALQAMLAIAACVGRHRRFALAMLAWVALTLAKTYDVRPISTLFNLIPMVGSTALFRYACPSWEFALAVGCALAIDGARRRETTKNITLVAAGMTFALILTGIWIGWPSVHDILHSRLRGQTYGSLGWAVLTVGAATWIVLRARTLPGAGKALAALVVLDAVLFFGLPIRSGMRHLSQHGQGVAYLQQHAGLQRVYTLGPISPNYGAYFGIAEVNHNYLPVLNSWVDYIHSHIDARADPIIFLHGHGTSSRTATGELTPQKLAAYRQIGVGYVVAPPNDRQELEPLFPPGSQAYSGPDMVIFALSDPRPYFSVLSGDCDIEARSRETLVTTCRTAAVLLRLEANYPGWHAWVDGKPVRLGTTDDFFQNVEVPAGTHTVTFGYRPTHASWMLAGLLGGLAFLLVGGALEWRRSEKRMKRSAG